MIHALADQEGIEVVGEAADGEEAIELIPQLRPGVVLMDIVMLRLNGFEATRRLTQESPELRIIGLSLYGDPEMAQAMRNMGAAVYVGKGEPLETLLEHIRGYASPKNGA